MSEMTAADVERAMLAHEDKETEYTWDTFHEWIEVPVEGVDVADLGHVSMEKDGSSGEGQGEYAFLVFRVKFEDGTEKLFRKEGYYSSYNGSEWDGNFTEVKPVERTVVFYE